VTDFRKTRRPKANWPHLRPKPPRPEWMRKYAELDQGKGVPQKLDDYASWLKWYEHPSNWVEAIYSFDDRRDKIELCALLRSDCDLPPTDREHLLNLIERYDFKSAKAEDFLRSLDDIERRGEVDTELALSALVRARRDLAETVNHYVSRLKSESDLSRSEHNRLADLFNGNDPLLAAYEGKRASYRRALRNRR